MIEQEHDGPTPASKAEFLRRLEAGRRELWAFIDALKPEQFTAKRDPAGWAIKDHLIHLAVWEKGITALLGYQPRYPVMGVDEALAFADEDTVDAMNDAIFVQHKDDSLDDVLAALKRAQAAFDQVVAAKSEADMMQTYSHYQPDEPGEESGAPIIGWMIGNTVEHYAEHLPWMSVLV